MRKTLALWYFYCYVFCLCHIDRFLAKNYHQHFNSNFENLFVSGRCRYTRLSPIRSSRTKLSRIVIKDQKPKLRDIQICQTFSLSVFKFFLCFCCKSTEFCVNSITIIKPPYKRSCVMEML